MVFRFGKNKCWIHYVVGQAGGQFPFMWFKNLESRRLALNPKFHPARLGGIPPLHGVKPVSDYHRNVDYPRILHGMFLNKCVSTPLVGEFLYTRIIIAFDNLRSLKPLNRGRITASGF